MAALHCHMLRLRRHKDIGRFVAAAAGRLVRAVWWWVTLLLVC